MPGKRYTAEQIVAKLREAEKLADQLDKWEQAKAVVAVAQAKADDEAATSRAVYQGRER